MGLIGEGTFVNCPDDRQTLAMQALLAFVYPESFDRQLGDRVNKRLKSPRARVALPGRRERCR
jgi:hypothetical protein